MIEGRAEIRRAFLSGTTRRVQLQIVDRLTGAGLQPSTATLSVYDVNTPSNQRYLPVFTILSPLSPIPALTSTIINGQNDVDVSAFIDADGQLDLYLDVDDTAIPVPPLLMATPYQRVLLFTWTWGSPAKTAKYEIVLAIAPDREGVAS